MPDAQDLAPIDFSTFIVSLAGNCMVHLGQGEASGQAPNLPLAKQTIDLLEVLVVKTKGNLDEEEDKLLQSVLYQCRMSYLGLTKG